MPVKTQSPPPGSFAKLMETRPENYVKKKSPTPSTKPKPKKPKATKQPRHRDTTIPRNHDTTVSRYHDTIIEIVRKAVKDFGKEAATHRFTIAEKKAIAEIIFSFKGKDIKTSENEITRIAVNFIIQDYKNNRSNSILEKALKALNE